MKKQFPRLVDKFMAKSYSTDEFFKLDVDLTKQVYIVRPSEVSKDSGFGGNGIIVVDSPSKLEQLKKLARTQKNLIVSEYITNPLLFNKRKFHLRICYVISRVNGVFRYFVYPKYKILTAKYPFVNADYDNKNIHDTHFKTTLDDYLAPDALPIEDKKAFYNIVNPNLEKLFSIVSKIVKPHCHPYPNAENAFELLGCDVMITDSYDVVLLEINNHIGHGYHKEVNRHIFSRNLFKLLNNGIFKYAFSAENRITK